MSKPAARREPQIRAIDAPPEWQGDWPDARVHCRTCRNKSGYICAATKTSCNASELPFYCDIYSARGNR